jgi:hypothetical protein
MPGLRGTAADPAPGIRIRLPYLLIGEDIAVVPAGCPEYLPLSILGNPGRVAPLLICLTQIFGHRHSSGLA